MHSARLAVAVVVIPGAAPAPAGPRTSVRTQDLSAHTTTTHEAQASAAPGSAHGHPPGGATSSPTASTRPAAGGAPLATTTTTSAGAATTTSTTATTTTGTAGNPGPSSGVATTPGSSCGATVPPVTAPAGGWQCSFDDEFNGSALDSANWQPQLTATSGYTTGLAPYQVCYVDNPDTISESGGVLNLSVVQTPTAQSCGSGTTSYEGGMVTSYQLFSQRYGFFEARAKLPAATLQGLQETLWLYPEDETLYGGFPDSGEIDYGEFYSEYPSLDVPVVHYPGSAGDPNATNDSCAVAGAATAGQFNTYALLWTPATITAYFNGQPCITDTYDRYVQSPDVAPEPFNQPFFMAFTAALGVNTDTPLAAALPSELPATTSIDWVRAWQYG